MDIKLLQRKGLSFVKKNKYVILILLIGLFLMTIPTGKKENLSEKTQLKSETEDKQTMAQQLELILAQVSGAGRVRVFLTEAAGERTVFQEDKNTTVNADTSTTQVKTIVISNANREESGLVQQVNPPTYLGAIVVCQGADDPCVQLAIVDAVSKVTGLGADRISVLKMK